MEPIKVDRNRTVVVQIFLPYDVTPDDYSSQIRSGRSDTSTLIATWTVTKHPTRKQVLLLTLDNSVTAAIAQHHGYMDIKRVTGGEPVSVIDEPLDVVFRGVVTA